MEDMRRETRKSRQLSHKNIVRIHDIYHLPGEAPFITMEFIEGQPLSSLKAEQLDRLFPWPYLEPLVAQMCDALDYAHEEKIVHRDLKPANIMIDATGRVKLADFGLAATISDSMVKVSKDMGVSGTPSYMGPQQLAGKPSKETDDIYSLGATIYELLTSKPPFFKGDIMHQIREEIPLTVEERLADLGLDNEVPVAVSRTIAACLDKDPAKRPQSAGEVAELMGCPPPSMSRRSIRGNANAAIPLDSPEATQMLSRLELSEETAPSPTDKPTFNFVDPPKSVGPASSPPTAIGSEDEETLPPPRVPSEEPQSAAQYESQDAPIPHEPDPQSEYDEPVAEELEPTDYEVAPEPSASPGKGKLFAIIGACAAALVLGLVFMFSGNDEQPQRAGEPSPTPPDSEDSPSGKNKLQAYGFVDLLQPATLNQTSIEVFESNENDITARHPFADNPIWRLNNSQLTGTLENESGDATLSTKLTLDHLALDGFEFGIVFELNGVRGGGPFFRFESGGGVRGLAAKYRYQSGDIRSVTVNKNDLTFDPTAGGDTAEIPESMIVLWNELEAAPSGSEHGGRLAVRFEGSTVLLRSSWHDGWQKAEVPAADLASLSDGITHHIRFGVSKNSEPRQINIRKYFLRTLKSADTLPKWQDLLTGITEGNISERGTDWKIGTLGLLAPSRKPILLPTPTLLGKNYDLQFRIKRQEVHDGISLFLPIGNGQSRFMFDSYPSYGGSTGLDQVKGIKIPLLEGTIRGINVSDLKSHELELQVRTSGINNSLRVLLDGKELYWQTGTSTTLAVANTQPVENVATGSGGIALACYAGKWIFERARLRVLPDFAPNWENVMANLATEYAKERGNGWHLQNGRLNSPRGAVRTIVIPKDIGVSHYRIRVQLERKKATEANPHSGLVVTLPVRNRSVSFFVDKLVRDDNGGLIPYTAIGRVAGRKYESDPGRRPGKQLPAGTHTLEISVHADKKQVELVATVNGNPLYRWSGSTDLNTYRQLENQMLPRNRVALTSWNAEWIVDSIEVQELTLHSSPTPDSDRERLLDGVNAIGTTASAADIHSLYVFGGTAFPVVAVAPSSGFLGSPTSAQSGIQMPIVAAARRGQSKILALGDESQLDPDLGDNRKFILNAVRWMRAGKINPSIGVRLSKENQTAALVNFLKAHGFNAKRMGGGGYTARISTHDIVCISGGHYESGSIRNRTLKSVKENGHSIIVAGAAKELNSNYLLQEFGLAWVKGGVAKNHTAGFAIPRTIHRLGHGAFASDFLKHNRSGTDTHRAQAQFTIRLGQFAPLKGDSLHFSELRKISIP